MTNPYRAAVPPMPAGEGLFSVCGYEARPPMTNPDYRAICAELVELSAPVDSISQLTERLQKLNELAARARALLAEPEPEGPTDEELLRVAAISIEPYESSGITPGEYEPETECAVEVYGSELIAYARAVLARWGRPAAPPVPEPGEVPRIGHILRLAEIIREVDGKHDKGAAALAEAILSHPGIRSAGLTAAAPVPVSERLPGPDDCDAEGRCWWWDGEWGLVEPRFVDFCATHWLPAHALPLPTPEATND